MHEKERKGRTDGAADESRSDSATVEEAPQRPVWARPDGDVETDFEKVAERAAAAQAAPVDEADDPPATTGDDGAADTDAEGEAGPDAADDDPAATIARLEAEKADLTDRLLRAVADMDNLRKRTERDLADTRKYGLAKFAGDLLTVGDNLSRALQAVSEEALAADTGPLKGLLDGVEMTARELDKVLERHGVTRIDPAGEKFDPHLHQAMFQADNPHVPAGTITEVIQTGYLIGDRVLRAAMVGVARGGPKQTADEPAASEPADASSRTDAQSAADPEGIAEHAGGDAPKGSENDRN